MKAAGRERAREKNNLSLMGFGDKKLVVPGTLLFCLYLGSSVAQPITEHQGLGCLRDGRERTLAMVGVAMVNQRGGGTLLKIPSCGRKLLSNS